MLTDIIIIPTIVGNLHQEIMKSIRSLSLLVVVDVDELIWSHF